MSTERLRAQHTKLSDLAKQLSSELKRRDAATRGAEIRAVLNRLSGALIVDLAAEDQGFYPRLMTDKRPRVAEVATRYQTDKDRFQQYLKRWTSDAISAEVAAFARDTTRMLSELMTRMEREERDLYPLDAAP